MEPKLAEFDRFMNTLTRNLSSAINRDIISLQVAWWTGREQREDATWSHAWDAGKNR